jgi:dynein light chain roadblock-type
MSKHLFVHYIMNGNQLILSGLNVLQKRPELYIFQAQEVEETMKRIQSHKGVVGTIVVNAEGIVHMRIMTPFVDNCVEIFIEFWFSGIPIKSTLDNTTTVQYAGLISQLSDKARSVVRDLDPTNDLTFLRIRSKKHEIMVAPDKEFILIVVQNPVD